MDTRVALIVSCALATQAGAQEFTSRALFLGAAPTSQLDDVESYTPFGASTGGAASEFHSNHFHVASTPDSIKILDVPAFGAFNTTLGGANYLYYDTDIGNVGADLVLTFNEPVTAFGFEYTDTDSTPLVISILGAAHSVAPSGNNANAFWGFVSSTPFTSLTIDSLTDSGWGMDDILVQAAGGVPCYPDCDQSGSLDFFDFLCFQNAFANADPYADCDQSGSLDFFDFLCFQNEFAAGCP